MSRFATSATTNGAATSTDWLDVTTDSIGGMSIDDHLDEETRGIGGDSIASE